LRTSITVRRVAGLLAAGALAGASTVIGAGAALAEPGGFDTADGVTTEYTVPAGICEVSWQIFGGGGGADAGDTAADPNRERRVSTFVSEGQVFTLAPGTAGASAADGSAAGTNTAYPGADGGPGDGTNGGGGGAASVVLDGDGQVYLYAYGVNGAGADITQYGAGGTVEGVGTGAEWIDSGSEDFAGDSEFSGADGRILGTEIPCGDGGGYEPPANEPPLAPVDVSAQAGDGQLTVYFSENYADGVDAVTSWEYRLGAGDWTTAEVEDNYGTWMSTLDGLTNGQTYTVRVRGVSEISGAGAASDPVTATPYEPLAAPTGVQVSTAPSALDITWDAPGAGGTFDLEGYKVVIVWTGEERGGIFEPCDTDAATRECYAGVPAGDDYVVYVHGVDSEGNGGLDSDPVETGVVPFPKVPDSVPTADAPLEGVDEGAALTNGETVTIHGDGFLPNSTIQAVIYSTPTPLGSFTVDGAGAFEIEVTIPDGLHAGEHSLVVSGLDPSGNPRYLRTDVTVSGVEGVLAYTGAEVAGPAIGGLTAVVVGSGLLVASRRRRTA
jgi:hypothetical protein